MITQARLLELFKYRSDGVLINRVDRPPAMTGQIAGTTTGRYPSAVVDGTIYDQHRLIFLYHHGWLPPQVDHADGVTKNNRIENLRAADAATNAMNRKVNCRSRTGVKNVRFDGVRQRFVVVVRQRGREIFVGRFRELEEASRAAHVAREKYHGEFANHGNL